MRDSNELRFDGWRLRRDSGELVRGEVHVRLQSQPLALLEALLARPGEVVTRDDLKSSLWPTGVVDFDTALNSAIRRLRRALGDEADAPRYIETLPRKGYRFIGVLEPEASAATSREPGPTPIPAPAPSLVPTAAPSVVAYPAVTLPQPASAQPAGRRRQWIVAAAAAALAGVAVPVVLHLEQPPGAASIAGPAGGASRPATELPRPAATPMAPAASAAPPRVPAAPGANPETRDRIGRARLLLQRRLPGDLPRARALLEEAVRFDPESADAHAALASVHWHLVLRELEPQNDGLERMRVAAERALTLDPRSVEAKQRLANYGYAKLDPRYRGYLDAALAAAPNSAFTLSTRASEAQKAGRLDEGVELARRAALAEPLVPVFRDNLASALYLAGRFDEAARVNREARDLSPAGPLEVTARVLILQRRYDEALALANDWPDAPARRQVVALALAAAGRTQEADAALRALIDVARERDPLRIAEVYAFRHDADRAVEWLAIGTRAFAGGPTRLQAGVFPWMLKQSPFAAPIHADPRWQAWAATTS